MHVTRNSTARYKQTRGGGTTPKQCREPVNKSGETSADDPDLENAELPELLNSLSEESRTLVKIIKMVITEQFRGEIQTLREELVKRDSEITQLKTEVKDLNIKVEDLESHLDSIEQYQRRDTVIISGPALPQESQHENPVHLIVNTLKDTLKINVQEQDISVAHRLGPFNQNHPRPMIVKLMNRSHKYDIIGACLTIKPDLYINESLTPSRLNLFKKILAIRKQHRQKFSQCHTKDGKIIVKLGNSMMKHIIVDERSLLQFLDRYPDMKDTYQEIVSSH